MKLKLKNKIKNTLSNWRIGDYIRQLSVVVVGIIITFAGSNFISERNNQKKLKTALQLVKNELTANRTEIESMKKRFDKERDFGNYINRYRDSIRKADADSLYNNQNIFFQTVDFTYYEDAMEMLKTSTLIQQIEDQELAMQLAKTYGEIRMSHANLRFYYSSKMELNKKLNNSTEFLKGLDNIQNNPHQDIYQTWEFMIKNYNFEQLYRLPTGAIDSKFSFSDPIASIDSMIVRLDNTYSLK